MKHAFLDLDDTVNGTRNILVHLMKTIHNYDAPEDIYLTSDNTDGYLGEILDSGEFMKHVNLNRGFPGLFGHLVRTNNLTINICTHRGYHPKGEEYTHEFLNNLGILDFLDEIIILDPKKNPNKVEFIKSELKLVDDEFIIIDDKPNFFSNESLCRNTILFDQFWNKDIIPFSKYHRISSLVEAIPVIDRFVKD